MSNPKIWSSTEEIGECKSLEQNRANISQLKFRGVKSIDSLQEESGRICRKKIFNGHFLDGRRNSKSEDDLLQWSRNAKLDQDLFKIDKTDKPLTKALQDAFEIRAANIPSNLEEDSNFIEEDYSYDNNSDNMMPPLQSAPSGGVVTDSQGLIVPKKLMNPCLESHDRKNLHRELLFNQKIGKNVLNQKSELQRVLEKQKERQFIQKENQDSGGLKGELGRVIMERAERIEKKNNSNQDDINNQLNPEYLNARAKLRARVDTK